MSAQPSAQPHDDAHPLPRASVLFVCNANICRSPVAHALFAAAVHGVTGETWTVFSAGIRATAGLPMVEECRAALGGTGFSWEFRSALLSPDVVRGADAVVTMTRTELSEVLRLVPTALHRTVTLAELHRCALRAPEGRHTNGPDRLRALVTRTVRDRGPTRPADPADDDIPDPVGRSRHTLAATTQSIGAAVRAVVATVAPGATPLR
ncbi:hypothetical protein [Actinokineospora sp. NBRC 105648]|uniref:arsenate reductase/protein-tyrosine-phosphatase family protein n=1 Tax=Actinokineospora sp. NBRC 105648 TaxID=3032206 RepID=UPI0024A528FA|nr:hypothetical protein [Actinokineospora sp. NBRC 105648]GLZ41879.1 low molecular weight phosphatase family protein [Actinokineospora sp. NBRC 105648]